jgi:hypothetical protein
MKKAVVLAVHHLESPRAVKITVDSFLQQGAVPVFVFDKLSPEVRRYMDTLRGHGIHLIPIGGFTWISTAFYGLGAARDAGFRHAMELGFDCVVSSDTHVLLLGDLNRLCADALAHGAAQGLRLDSPFSAWPRVGPEARPWYGPVFSISLRNRVDVFDCRLKPWSYEPLMAFSSSALRRLADLQEGRVILGRGFGAELPDLSMSLSRLGYDVACTPVAYVHRYSTGSEEFWRGRWDELQYRLWAESFGVYLVKHVPERYRERSPYAGFEKYVAPWQLEIAKRFNEVARPTEEVYRRFIESRPRLGSPPALLME